MKVVPSEHGFLQIDGGSKSHLMGMRADVERNKDAELKDMSSDNEYYKDDNDSIWARVIRRKVDKVDDQRDVQLSAGAERRTPLSRVMSQLSSLHQAAKYGDVKVIKEQINNGADIHGPCTKGIYIDLLGKTSLFIAVENKHNPAANVLMDRCITDEIDNQTQERVVTYDFKEFKTRENVKDGSYKRRFDPLRRMVINNDLPLMVHRLSRAYIDYMWTSFGRYAYALLVLFHIIFLTFVTRVVVAQKGAQLRAHMSQQIVTGLSSPLNTTACDPPILSKMDEKTKQELCNSATKLENEAALAYLLAYSLLAMLFEVYQMVLSFSKHSPAYFKSMENWLQIGMYFSTIAFTTMNFIGVESGNDVINLWNLASVAVLLSWYQMMIYMRMLPGGYVAMFEVTLWRVFRVFFIFVFAVIGFGFAFYCIRNEHFPEMDTSILKSLAMTHGELNYESLFPADTLMRNGTFMDSMRGLFSGTHVSNRRFSSFLFFIFVLAMPIVMMNLLTGIAVYDVNRLQKTSQALVYIERFKFLHLLPNFLLHRWAIPKETYTIRQNEEEHACVKRCSIFIEKLFTNHDPFETITIEKTLSTEVFMKRAESNEAQIAALATKFDNLADKLVDMMKDLKKTQRKEGYLDFIEECNECIEDCKTSNSF